MKCIEGLLSLFTVVTMTRRDIESTEHSDNTILGDIKELTDKERKLFHQLEQREEEFLPPLRDRMEKWVTITSGIASVFGIGSVLTSVNLLRDVVLGWKICFAVLQLSGFGFLLASAFCAFPTEPDKPVANTREEVKQMIDMKKTNRPGWKEVERFKLSKFLTLAGFFLIAVATALSWFAPQDAASDSTTQSGK